MKLNEISLLLTTLLLCGQKITSAPSSSAPFKASQPLPGPLDSADQAAIAYLEKEAAREKRGSSDSGDILNHIKHSIGQGIKNKISQIAKSSAGASAYFSKSSSAHHHDYEHQVPHSPHYPPPPQYYPVHGHGHSHDDKPFDLWSIKKSVLYTLLQAVKAIKGGVIAIKGQLIKGGGHLLTAKGKLIRGGGEALTHLGKNIALSAFHWAPTAHQEEEVIHEHHGAEEHPSAGYGYSAPSGGGLDVPPSGYGPPTGGAPYYHNSVYDGKTSQQQHDGLIILRKIPKNLRHPADADSEHTNDDQQQHEDPHELEHGHHHPHHHVQHHAEYVHHKQDQQDVQESQKTPAFRPLSDGIVPKMKNLVSSVLQSSGGYIGPQSQPSYPPKSQGYADNAASHSQYNTQYNPKTPVTVQKHVKPQQANIGSLVNYLEYIRRQQKTGPKQSQGSGSNGDKVKPSVYVTPASVIIPKDSKPAKSAAKAERNKGGEKVTQEHLKHETVLLEQQLQQLASLQNLQNQLQILNPYAAQVAHQGESQPPQVLVRPNGVVQPNGVIQPNGVVQPNSLVQPNDVVPPRHPMIQSPLGSDNPPNNDPQIFLQTQTFPTNYEIYNSQGVPLLIGDPTNADLASLLTQYQIVPETPTPSLPPQQPQQIQQQPQINPQFLEDPMQEAESSQVNTFLIHVPDEDIQESRSLRQTYKNKPKSKRHSRPYIPSVTKPKKLSQLQQVQLMQQQLHHHQPKTVNERKQTKRSPTSFDVIRSFSFELGPNGFIQTHH